MRHLSTALALLLMVGCDEPKGAPGTDSAAPEEVELPDARSSEPRDDPKNRKYVEQAPTETATVVPLPPPPSGPATAIPFLTASASAAAPAPIDYFLSATSIPLALQTKLAVPAGIRVLELVIYPKYVVTQVQDPERPLHIDAYTLREGVVAAPKPVKLIGKAKTEADLGKLTFDLGEIDWTLLPRMVIDAPRRLKVEDPEVSHLRIARPVPFEEEVRVRVFVKGSRGNGSVMYNLGGAMTKVHE